jgi:hypothetical protein
MYHSVRQLGPVGLHHILGASICRIVAMNICMGRDLVDAGEKIESRVTQEK